MEIVVNDNFSISTDERNFILKQKITRTSRLGEKYDDWSEFYYPKIEQLFDAMIRKGILASDAENFKALYNFVADLFSDIVEVCQTDEYKVMVNHVVATKKDGAPPEAGSDIPLKKKRGRPKGSTNKKRK